MTQPIVVGVDGSATAAKAASVAARLAQATGAPLHVVCAYVHENYTPMREGAAEYVWSTEDSALQVADRAAREVMDLGPSVTTSAVHAKPAAALISEAERLQAGLIVVGNKHVQGLSRVLGSVALEVAHKASCDVYIAQTHR